jgi:hypothetical protein
VTASARGPHGTCSTDVDRAARAVRPTAVSRPEVDDVESGDGFEETLEVKFADRLDLHEVFHRGQQTLGDEDLAGLGLPAEA